MKMTNGGIRRRAVLAVVGLVCAALTACGSGSGAEDVPTIKFGYIADFNGAYALAVAKEQGLWEKHGVKVDAKVFTNGPLQIQAMQTGDLDMGSIGPGAFWMAAKGDAKVVAINGLGLADRVISQPDSGITTMQDLKGRKVGVAQGTSGDMIFQLALRTAGMKESDVEVVHMDPSTIVTAMAGGQIEAAALWYPLIDTIKSSRPGIVEIASSEQFYPEHSFPGTIVAGNSFTEENSDAIVRLLRVLQDANDYREQNQDETVALTAEFLSVPEENVASNARNIKYPTTAELVAQSEDGTAAGWLSGLADLFVAMDKLEAPGDVGTYYLDDLWVKASER